ncbi:MAG: HEAT repeat domain-containing protein [Planctomycetes bacterium]|nr:HEAT repeat domain-containing protein [Planctomycetota bacterium]
MLLRFLCLQLWSLFPGAGGQEAGAAEKLRQAAAEIEEIARVYEGGGAPENEAPGRRLRAALREAAAIALAPDPEASRAAWKLLEGVLARGERRVAVEAVLLLLSQKNAAARRAVLRALPSMEPAVCRYACEYVKTSRLQVAECEQVLLEALRGVRDLEAKAILAELAGELKSLACARALLDVAPPLPERPVKASSRTAAADRFQALRQALLSSLQAFDGAAAEWLAGKAFEEAEQEKERAAAKLWALSVAAGRQKNERARAALERLASHPQLQVGLEALRALEKLGAEASREALRAAAASAVTDPAAAARAAALLGSFDEKAGLQAVFELGWRKSWEARREAALALADFPESVPAYERLWQLLEGDPNREVRQAAYQALRAFRRPEAIPRAIALLSPLQGRDPPFAREYLQWAAGRPLGNDAGAWREWWKAAEKNFRFPEPSKDLIRQLRSKASKAPSERWE